MYVSLHTRKKEKKHRCYLLTNHTTQVVFLIFVYRFIFTDFFSLLTTLCPFDLLNLLSLIIDPPQLFSIAIAPDLTKSPLQDLASPLPAAPGREIPRCQYFVPEGNMPRGRDTALKSPASGNFASPPCPCSHRNLILSLWCSLLLV